MNIGDLKHLEWIYNRMIDVHGENKNVDYMLRFNKMLDDDYHLDDEPKIISRKELEPIRITHKMYSDLLESKTGKKALRHDEVTEEILSKIYGRPVEIIEE